MIGQVRGKLRRISLAHCLLAEPVWLIRIDEFRFCGCQCRRKKNVLAFHRGDQSVINVAIAYAAHEAIDSRFHQVFAIAQIKNFGDNLQIVLVRFFDSGSEDVGLELGALAVTVIHPKLDGVDFLVGQIRNRPFCI